MADDEISEIRRIRHEISKRYGHDVKRLVAHYQELQKELKASAKYKLANPKRAAVASNTDENAT